MIDRAGARRDTRKLTHHMKALTPIEIADLERLEAVVEKGKQTFVDVGLAITEIRERKLYRRDYDTFEVYCQKRWGWTRQRGHQLIEAAAVVEALPKNLSTMVDKERTARELAKFPVPVRKEVIEDIQKNGEKVTAATVKKRFPPPPTRKPESELPNDKVGYPIPEKIIPIWDDAMKWREHMTAISSTRSALRHAQEEKDVTCVEINYSSALSHLDQAYSDLKRAIPFAVCASCQGQRPSSCIACKGRGFVSQFFWENCVAKETKAIREKARK